MPDAACGIPAAPGATCSGSAAPGTTGGGSEAIELPQHEEAMRGGVQLFVKTPAQEAFLPDVEAGDTLNNVKARIHFWESVTLPDQSLTPAAATCAAATPRAAQRDAPRLHIGSTAAEVTREDLKHRRVCDSSQGASRPLWHSYHSGAEQRAVLGEQRGRRHGLQDCLRQADIEPAEAERGSSSHGAHATAVEESCRHLQWPPRRGRARRDGTRPHGSLRGVVAGDAAGAETCSAACDRDGGTIMAPVWCRDWRLAWLDGWRRQEGLSYLRRDARGAQEHP